MPSLRATIRERAINSSAEAPDPGAYMSPEESPAAPSCSASSSKPAIASICRGVSALPVLPATFILRDPCPTSDATVATLDWLALARYSRKQPHPHVSPPHRLAS